MFQEFHEIYGTVRRETFTVHLSVVRFVCVRRPYGRSVPSYERLFAAVQAVMLKSAGKPHWGKTHNLTFSQLSTLYDSDASNMQLRRFIHVRNELDPQRMFTNDYLRRVLGD